MPFTFRKWNVTKRLGLAFGFSVNVAKCFLLFAGFLDNV